MKLGRLWIFLIIFIIPTVVSAETFIMGVDSYGKVVHTFEVSKLGVAADGKDATALTFKVNQPVCYFENDTDRRSSSLDYNVYLDLDSGSAAFSTKTLRIKKYWYSDPYHLEMQDPLSCGGEAPYLNHKTLYVEYETAYLTSTKPSSVVVAVEYAPADHISPRGYWSPLNKPIVFASASPTIPKASVPVSSPDHQPIKPETPSLLSVRVGQHEVSAFVNNGAGEFVYDPIRFFSGKTIPGGIVHLYFHSDPFQDTTTADSNGDWVYELVKDIGEGNHELQIAVTDPVTNLTSEKSESLKFTFLPDDSKIGDSKIEVGVPSPTKVYYWRYVAVGIIAFLLIGISLIIWKREAIKRLFLKRSLSSELNQDEISKE